MIQPPFQVEPKSMTAESGVILANVSKTNRSETKTGIRPDVILPPWGRHIGGPPVCVGTWKIGGTRTRGRAHAGRGCRHD